MDSANINAVISAISGLAGVGIGALLTHLRELRAERIRDDRDASYLAILVITHLDRFANGCLSVAYDDGTSEGRPASKDAIYHHPTVKAPTFAPLDIKVEWRVLPRKLMYDILEIPAEQERLENRLGNVWEYDDPPEYGDFFMRRQRDYAALGLKVSGIAKRLRVYAHMPIEEHAPGSWDRDAAMQAIIGRLDAERAANENRQAEWPAPPPPAPMVP